MRNGDCDLYTLGGFSATPCGSGNDHDWLYFIDPPAEPAPNDVTHLCSTECPGAHNQKYVSEFGKVTSIPLLPFFSYPHPALYHLIS